MQSNLLSVSATLEGGKVTADECNLYPPPERLPHSEKPNVFRQRFFPGVSPELWNDWYWQLSNRLTTYEKINQIFNLSSEEKEALTNSTPLPVAITPYYASLIDPENSCDPLRKCMIPTSKEWCHSDGEAEDPLGEDHQSPVEGLVHRYPDRVLFLVTSYCSSNCRYCTRSRVVGHKSLPASKERWINAIKYIKEHREVRDVLISGGDPLTLSTKQLDWLLFSLRQIEHVEIIRIGTKVPMVLPQRITRELVDVLKKYHPLFISVHATHPVELVPESIRALSMLADVGIPIGSQTVLLKGVNDNAEVMKDLMHGLLKARARPYYLYQCDPIIGSSHFRTPVKSGLEIIKSLRGWTSGYAVPTFVIDAPGGGGKIPLCPDYVLGSSKEGLILQNYESNLYSYPDI